MMNYGYVSNGQVEKIGLPKVWKMKDGRDVSGFDRLPAEALADEGWLPIVDPLPSLAWDAFTQTIRQVGYEVAEGLIKLAYLIEDIVTEEPDPLLLLTPSPEEVAKAEREIETLDLLIELGVIV